MSTPFIYNPNKQPKDDHNRTLVDLPNIPSQLQEEKFQYLNSTKLKFKKNTKKMIKEDRN